MHVNDLLIDFGPQNNMSLMKRGIHGSYFDSPCSIEKAFVKKRYPIHIH